MTLRITRGDDETLTVLVTDPDNADAPLDLTGTALTFMVKRFRDDDDDDALVTKTTADGITLSNQSTDPGEATINLDAVETDVLRPGVRHAELQSVSAAGEVKTLWVGNLQVIGDLIRETTGS